MRPIRAGPAADLDALDELQRRVDAAIVGADVESYLTYLTEDAVLMPPDLSAIVGHGKIAEWSATNARAMRFVAYEPTDEELVVAGDWAFRRARAHWSLEPTGGGAPVDAEGKFIVMYRREPDGVWKLARDIWNASPPAKPLQQRDADTASGVR